MAWRPDRRHPPPVTKPAVRSPLGHQHAGPAQYSPWAEQMPVAHAQPMRCSDGGALRLQGFALLGGAHLHARPTKAPEAARTPHDSALQNHLQQPAAHGAHEWRTPGPANAWHRHAVRRWNLPPRCKPPPMAMQAQRLGWLDQSKQSSPLPPFKHSSYQCLHSNTLNMKYI